jgi:alpha-galactosidase
MPPARPASPALNGARIFGCRPGSPVIISLAASGTGPLKFEADPLPRGLRLDAKTGRLSGRLAAPGRHAFTVRISGPGGVATDTVTVVCGARLALTPPMGWSSWNCWADHVSADNVLASARAMAEQLAPHGWTYVNIDDAWQGERARTGDRALQSNDKFPDMAALVEQIHGLGLRAGIYSSPWATTYAGFRGDSCDDSTGRYFDAPAKDDWWPRRAAIFNGKGLHSFTAADARQYAKWGFDYLKYDWFPIDGPATRACAAALRDTGRDIVLSLSNSLAPSTLPDVLGHAQLWRTTNDLRDTWYNKTTSAFPFQGVRDIIGWHDAFQPFQSPGAWNDPDMLVLGHVGWGPELRPTRLTRDEQTTHFALWCLWSAPLLIGCPLDRLDAFTRALLTNDELIALNQDACGLQAWRIREKNDCIVYRKPLLGGANAYGLLNLSDESREITLDWKLAGLSDAPHAVRDVVARRDLGVHRRKITVGVPAHGIAVLRPSLA